MKAIIRAIDYHLPETVLSNEQLSAEFPGWSVEKIEEKTGIRERRIATADEFASDLGAAAVQRLFASGACQPSEVDFLLYCTQSPDYYLPTTACLLQERLSIPTSAGALDFNLGCSGYIYGLGLAKGLIETGQARNVVLVTAETYSKFIYPQDRSVRTLFGDGAAATLIQGIDADMDGIGPFVYGTDGRGAANLIVPSGGLRQPVRGDSVEIIEDENGNLRTPDSLYMNGAEILTFTLQAVPASSSRRSNGQPARSMTLTFSYSTRQTATCSKPCAASLKFQRRSSSSPWKRSATPFLLPFPLPSSKPRKRGACSLVKEFSWLALASATPGELPFYGGNPGNEFPGGAAPG